MAEHYKYVSYSLNFIPEIQFLVIKWLKLAKNQKHNLKLSHVDVVSFRTIHPIKYYRNYIAHNIRPDGREFESFRPIRINVKSIGTADGSSIVKLGNTTVICGIKAVSLNLYPRRFGKNFIILSMVFM